MRGLPLVARPCPIVFEMVKMQILYRRDTLDYVYEALGGSMFIRRRFKRARDLFESNLIFVRQYKPKFVCKSRSAVASAVDVQNKKKSESVRR